MVRVENSEIFSYGRDLPVGTYESPQYGAWSCTKKQCFMIRKSRQRAFGPQLSTEETAYRAYSGDAGLSNDQR
jgi:hypothetical protein